MNKSNNLPEKLPPWLKKRIPPASTSHAVSQTLELLRVNTICRSADCPNCYECWSQGRATVLLLGTICTRNCKFCAVNHGKPESPDFTEPGRIAHMTRLLAIKYLVLTSVSRDDLPDGGARHFRDCITRTRESSPATEFEILTPDFRGCQDQALEILAEAREFVFSHNIETIPRLYGKVRPGADYDRSLRLLGKAKKIMPGLQTKSALLLGLGESDNEVETVLEDLRSAGCDRIAIGQYLRPSSCSLPVVEYLKPEKFSYWRKRAIELHYRWVESSPFARSSYFAEKPSIQGTHYEDLLYLC